MLESVCIGLGMSRVISRSPSPKGWLGVVVRRMTRKEGGKWVQSLLKGSNKREASIAGATAAAAASSSSLEIT